MTVATLAENGMNRNVLFFALSKEDTEAFEAPDAYTT